MSKAPIPAEAREISYEAFSRAQSSTAASATNKLFGKSGEQRYRVVLGQSGGAMTSTVVTAETGDDAADAALRSHPGWKCINVTPATDEYRDTGGVDALAAQAA